MADLSLDAGRTVDSSMPGRALRDVLRNMGLLHRLSFRGVHAYAELPCGLLDFHSKETMVRLPTGRPQGIST